MVMILYNVLWTAFCLISGFSGLQIYNFSPDIQGVAGDPSRLDCSAQHSSTDVPTCTWRAPDRSVYVPGRQYSNLNITVESADNSTRCTLYISSISSRDTGAWNCEFKQNKVPAISVGKYIYADLISGEQIIRLTELNVVKEGDTANLVCPTTLRPVIPSQRPICTWVSPTKQTINIVGRKGEIYQHTEFSPYGDIDRGECGISIETAELGHQGVWTCRIISKFSSKILEAELNLKVEPATSPLMEQPLTRSNQAVFEEKFTLPTTVDILSAYWILKRELILQQGKSICISGLSDCIESGLLTSTPSPDQRSTTFSINIIFINFREMDISDPLVLVVEYKDNRNNEQRLYRVVENFSEVSSKSTVGLIEDEESITEAGDNSSPVTVPEFATESSELAGSLDSSKSTILGDPMKLEENLITPILTKENQSAGLKSTGEDGGAVDACSSQASHCLIENFKLGDGESRTLTDFCLIFHCSAGQLRLERIQNCAFTTLKRKSSIVFPNNK